MLDCMAYALWGCEFLGYLPGPSGSSRGERRILQRLKGADVNSELLKLEWKEREHNMENGLVNTLAGIEPLN